MSNGTELIAAERLRQITEEGWTPEHDDGHADSALVEAAVAYARYGDAPRFMPPKYGPPACWPWGPEWWKPASRIRSLVKAGALIAAEIDRLQRAGTGSDDERGLALDELREWFREHADPEKVAAVLAREDDQ